MTDLILECPQYKKGICEGQSYKKDGKQIKIYCKDIKKCLYRQLYNIKDCSEE